MNGHIAIYIRYAEINGQVFLLSDYLRHGITDLAIGLQGNVDALSHAGILNILCRAAAGNFRLLGNIVNQIMYVQYVTAGKNTFYIRLTVLVNHRTTGNAIKGHTCALGQLILRNQTNGQKQRITGNELLGTGYGLTAFDFSNGYTFQTLFAVDLDNGMAQLQGNVKVIQTLLNVTSQTAGIGHQFANSMNLCTFQSHTASHDQTDITGTQNDNFFTGHITHLVYILLCSTGTKDTGRTAARNIQRTFGTLTTAHGQNDSLGFDLENTIFFVGGGDHFIVGNIQYHGTQFKGNAQFSHLGFILPGILRTGQFFTKFM